MSSGLNPAETGVFFDAKMIALLRKVSRDHPDNAFSFACTRPSAGPSRITVSRCSVASSEPVCPSSSPTTGLSRSSWRPEEPGETRRLRSGPGAQGTEPPQQPRPPLGANPSGRLQKMDVPTGFAFQSARNVLCPW
jgi:hypothetical protein